MAPRTWTPDEVTRWFASRIPSGWFVDDPDIRFDREEIMVIGRLGDPAAKARGSDDDRETVAQLGTVEGFREKTRAERIAIADDAETLWGRKVSWGVRCGTHEVHFTSAAVPVMTRLRMSERAVLDTLIEAGVARSRSEALAWCVRLVAEHERDWIDELRGALDAVARARATGPNPR